MRKKPRKTNKSFRLTPEVAELIAKAADRSGVSEADIVEECVVETIETVIRNHQHKAQLLASPEALDIVTGLVGERRVAARAKTILERGTADGEDGGRESNKLPSKLKS